jgi:hypothetical protein
MPWLQLGPSSQWLLAAMITPSPRSTSFVRDSKATILDANYDRLQMMRRAFVVQAFGTFFAAALALIYTAWK